MSTTELHLSIHDTPTEVYAAFVRTFGEEGESTATRWVTFYTQEDGVRVTLFAPRTIPTTLESDEA